MLKHFWLIRAFPEGVDHTTIFQKKNIIGLGWINLNDLSQVNINNLEKLFIKKNYLASSPQAMGRQIGFFRRFVKEMAINDYVLVPDGNGNVDIGIVKSQYYYKKVTKQLAHLRNVEWIKKIDLHSFPKHVQSLLSNRLTMISLDKVADELSRIIQNDNEIKFTSYLDKRFIGTINDKPITLTVDADITKNEITLFFKSILSKY